MTCSQPFSTAHGTFGLRTFRSPPSKLHGSTIVLSAVFERAPLHDDECVFDPTSAHMGMGFTVVDEESGDPMPVGETGRVVMHHVSKPMLMPNVL